MSSCFLLTPKVKVTWNRPYAEGGFTQVFEAMNQKLKDNKKIKRERRIENKNLDY